MVFRMSLGLFVGLRRWTEAVLPERRWLLKEKDVPRFLCVKGEGLGSLGGDDTLLDLWWLDLLLVAKVTFEGDFGRPLFSLYGVEMGMYLREPGTKYLAGIWGTGGGGFCASQGATLGFVARPSMVYAFGFTNASGFSSPLPLPAKTREATGVRSHITSLPYL